jgi:hypothetical protein
VRAILEHSLDSQASEQDLWEEEADETICEASNEYANALRRRVYETAGRKAPELVTLVRAGDKCYNCGKAGHYTRDCFLKAKDPKYPTAYKPPGADQKIVPPVDKKVEGKSGNSKGN